MSPHVYELIEWTLRLRGQEPNGPKIRERLRMIPHGIDLADYAIPTPEEKRAARDALGIPQGMFVLLQVERNQQRKQNYLGLHVMEELFKKDPTLRGKVLLYQHMQPDEESQGCRLGYDLPRLAWRYGLRAGQDVVWPRSFLPENSDAHGLSGV